MPFRVGRILRLFVGLACLVLMVPFLMSKLDSASRRSNASHANIDYPDVSHRICSSVSHWYLNIIVDTSSSKQKRLQYNRK
jgi:hypothetical protein